MRTWWQQTLAGLRETLFDLTSPWRRLPELSALSVLSPERDSSGMARRIAAQQFRALARNYPAYALMSGVGIALWQILSWIYRPGWVAALWGLSALGLTLCTAWFARRFLREQPPDDSLRGWEVRCARMGAVMGVVWGLAIFTSHSHIFVSPYLALGSLLVVVVALNLHAIYRPHIVWMTLPCALVTTLIFVCRGDAAHVAIGLVYGVAVVQLVRLARTQNTLMTQVMAAAEERLVLLNELEHERGAAQQAHQAKTRFLATVSQDLRQPIHAVALLISTLRQQTCERGEVLEQMGASIRKMDEMLADLLCRGDGPNDIKSSPQSGPAAGLSEAYLALLPTESRAAAAPFKSQTPWWQTTVRGLRTVASDVISPWRRMPEISLSVGSVSSEASSHIAHQQFRAYLGTERAGALATAVVGVLAVGVLWLISPGPQLVAWAVGLFALIAAIGSSASQYERGPVADDQLRAWEVRHGRLALLKSTLWGSVWFVFPATHPHAAYVAAGLLLVMAGSMSRFVSYPPAIAWLCVPCAVLNCVGLASTGQIFNLVHSIAFGVTVVFMVRLGWVQNALITQAMQAEQERMVLLTELESQRAAAQQANEAKTRFLAAVSHDLRQPMHAIALLSSALHKSILTSDEAPSTLVQMGASVQVMDDLLAALLEVSKLDDGALPLLIAAMPLASLFKRIELQFAAQAQAKGLVLKVMTCDACIVTDAYQFQRVLANLVANAIRYTLQGCITVRCRLRGSTAWLQVWDSGIGIARADRHHIFEEFVQLNNSAQTYAAGVGLGLSIVQKVAQRLGHPVVLRSRLGRGSMFAVGVPLDRLATAAALVGEGEAQLAQSLRGQLVLLIDDDAAVRDSMRLLLETFECHVLSADSTACALEAVQGSLRTPDLIISDFRLGQGDTGIHAIKRVRGLLEEDVPALLVSAELTAAHTAAKTLGLVVLAKPLRVQALAAELAKLI